MQQLFPTVYSTFCTDALARLVAEKYGLENVHCQMLLRGVGDTYMIRAQQGRYILRIYRSSHRSYGQIKAETELLIALKAAAVPVSYPIEDLSQNLIQKIDAAEGERHAVLFSYAPGRSESRLSEEQLQILGQQMARFHEVSSAIQLSNPRWQINLETTLSQPLEMVKFAFAEDQETYGWLCDAVGMVKQKLSAINTAAFATGWCHFDFLPKNFHFDGGAVTFFDFDFFGYGWLVYDIMSFWQHLGLEVHFGRMTRDEASQAYNTFLDAYQKNRPLLEDEIKVVPYISLGFWLYYLGFYTTHDQFYILLQPAHLKARTTLIKQLMERNWEEFQ